MFTARPVLAVLAVAFLFLLACSSPPAPVTNYDISYYDLIDENFNWDALALSDGDILPIEQIDGQLAIIKEQYRAKKRPFSAVRYAGLLFRCGSGGRSALGSHRLIGLASNRELVQRVIEVKKKLIARPTTVAGLVLFLDAAPTISDQQLTALIKAPASCIMLNGLQYVSSSQAEILSKFAGKSICLNGLLWLGRDQAAAFADFTGDYLSFNAVQTVDKEVSRSLSRFGGEEIYMVALDVPSEQMMRELQSPETARLITFGN